ncbi:MAG: hypothetical protein HQM10_04390 [Candidatus Riflebacteria bacterium]|nr:hypothetical protein [Candidatus Riflebacteria bacterium]
MRYLALLCIIISAIAFGGCGSSGGDDTVVDTSGSVSIDTNITMPASEIDTTGQPSVKWYNVMMKLGNEYLAPYGNSTSGSNVILNYRKTFSKAEDIVAAGWNSTTKKFSASIEVGGVVIASPSITVSGTIPQGDTETVKVEVVITKSTDNTYSTSVTVQSPTDSTPVVVITGQKSDPIMVIEKVTVTNTSGTAVDVAINDASKYKDSIPYTNTEFKIHLSTDTFVIPENFTLTAKSASKTVVYNGTQINKTQSGKVITVKLNDGYTFSKDTLYTITFSGNITFGTIYTAKFDSTSVTFKTAAN